MLGLGLSVTQLAARGLRLTDLAAAIRSLFASGEQGVWYDPSDLSTLFQDAAGTTPVTAVEQPVGLMRDKSGRNNHAFQTTSVNRPVLSARYNLLTKTEQFDDAVWGKAISGTGSLPVVTANAGVAPDGTTTADRVQFSLGGGTATAAYSYLSQALTTNIAHTLSFYAKLNSGTATIYVRVGNTEVTYVIASGWTRISLSCPSTNTSNQIGIGLRGGQSTPCTDTADILLWGADLRVANDGVNLPPYQRVNTTTDYDTVGFPPYLSFNGSNQWLQTNSIDFTATDKVTVFAGVRKLSDAAGGAIAEFDSIERFGINTSIPATTGNYRFVSQGTAFAPAISDSTYVSPITNVLTGIGNISGDQAILRVNGTQAAISTDDQGTGNYGNYPLYIGARAGTSLWFNGRLYQLIARGAQSTDQQIIDAERYTNEKTRAY